jgi:hypothetical protein
VRTDAVAADSVFAALERVRFRALRFNTFGNMTCALELIDGEGKHAVTCFKGQPQPSSRRCSRHSNARSVMTAVCGLDGCHAFTLATRRFQ